MRNCSSVSNSYRARRVFRPTGSTGPDAIRSRPCTGSAPPREPSKGVYTEGIGERTSGTRDAEAGDDDNARRTDAPRPQPSGADDATVRRAIAPRHAVALSSPAPGRSYTTARHSSAGSIPPSAERSPRTAPALRGSVHPTAETVRLKYRHTRTHKRGRVRPLTYATYTRTYAHTHAHRVILHTVIFPSLSLARSLCRSPSPMTDRTVPP